MAATPLGQECLPVTLGKAPTWKTMVVPVRSISTGESSFFESWLAEQGIDAAEATGTALSALPHVIEEQHQAKSFDLVHEADSPAVSGQAENDGGEVAKVRRPRNPVTEAKSNEPAPSPVVEPETQRELSEVEKAMRWTAPR